MWALVHLHNEESIWKTSRAYKHMRRAALKCTARETATLRSRSLTSVSSNSLSLGMKLIEWDYYETKQSSLLYVFVLFFCLDLAKNKIAVYY